MRIKIFIASLMLLSIVSCKSKSAFEYNENFVKRENSLVPEITKTEDNVGKFYAAQQFDSVAAVGERMESLIENQIAEIKKQPSPDANGAEKFKASMLRYFEFMKSIYTKYKNLGNAKTEAERGLILEDISTTAAKKNTVLSDLRDAQMEYAKANNFRMEK